MAAKRRLRLTDAAIARLRPEGREPIIYGWDTQRPRCRAMRSRRQE